MAGVIPSEDFEPWGFDPAASASASVWAWVASASSHSKVVGQGRMGVRGAAEERQPAPAIVRQVRHPIGIEVIEHAHHVVEGRARPEAGVSVAIAVPTHAVAITVTIAIAVTIAVTVTITVTVTIAIAISISITVTITPGVGRRSVTRGDAGDEGTFVPGLILIGARRETQGHDQGTGGVPSAPL